MEFTKEQQQAIDIRDKNILVSAAAGSGKTAVLVNRIINRVLDAENPVDIDRILVMTFTRAAAAQMKERILNAINEMRNECNKCFAFPICKYGCPAIGLSNNYIWGDDGVCGCRKHIMKEYISN